MTEAVVVSSRGAGAAAEWGNVGASEIEIGGAPSSGGNPPRRSSALGITVTGWTSRWVGVMVQERLAGSGGGKDSNWQLG